MYHQLRVLAAAGIFTTISIVSQGYFWNGLRNATIDCSKGSTQNSQACLVDWLEVLTNGVVSVTSASAAVYAAFYLPKRDSFEWDDSDIAYVDGQELHKLEVFKYSWMKENLLEGERKYILHNSTKGGGKVMTEAWKEGKFHKHTHYAHVPDGQVRKRSQEGYIHTSYEVNDIKREYPKIATSYTDARNAAQQIFDDLRTGMRNANCVGFEFHPPGGVFEIAFLGVSGSYVKSNTAPTCKNPNIYGGYSQIGDMYLTGYKAV